MFEYKIINSADKNGNPDDEFELNELSKRGWDLVTIRQSFAGDRFYFRRILFVELSVENYRVICAECGNELEHVRPGKYQCNHCESRPAV